MVESNRTKVLVAEDHAVVGEALVRLLNRQNDLICCGKVESVVAIAPEIDRQKPDVLLLDLLLKDADSTSLIPSLVSRYPNTRVLVFSQLDGSSHAEAILKAGAQGLVTKEETSKELLTAIRTVMGGEIYLSRKIAGRLLHKFIDGKPANTGHQPQLSLPLSVRERQVFQLIGAGRKTADIAGELNLSVKTIETHRENIKRKLGVKTASELAHRAIEWVQNKVPQ
ncbi:MAG TPA: response regulator transcription factor [Candidatus Sulfotelmatobacter sp.]|jgi:DNA-binding NarL/FixJ family response regulator|nr:response regulator transcription factor [Candidatus Sulfotelmatobacter sp.]